MLALSQTLSGCTNIQTRETNSVIESWMGIVKQNILTKRLHLRPGDFLRKMHVNISQRLAGIFLNISKSSKQRRKRNQEHSEEAVEVWKPKKKKGNYYINPMLGSKCHSQNSKSFQLSQNLSKDNKSERDFSLKIKIPIKHYLRERSRVFHTNTSIYDSDSSYEYHDFEEYSTSNCYSNSNFDDKLNEFKDKKFQIFHPSVSPKKMWLKDLGLTIYDHQSLVLKSGWLGSNLIWAVQTILNNQFSMNNSFQDTLYSQRATHFMRSPIGEKNVQIFHTGISHWVSSATIDGKVLLMDSLYSSKMSIQLEEQITSIFLSTGDQFILDILNVDQQTDTSSCGPYAIAFAYHTCVGDDVSQMHFDDSKLREHIESCLILGKFSSFRHKKTIRNRIMHKEVIETATCCH